MRMRRGFTVVEVLVAAAILLVGCVVLISVFSGSLRRSEQSKNRTAAIVLAQSLLDEVQDHRFGRRPPKHWALDKFAAVNPVDVWLDGKHENMTFHYRMKFANGSAIGQSAGDDDVVTVIITWQDAAGSTARNYGALGAETWPGDNQKIVAALPLWR